MKKFIVKLESILATTTIQEEFIIEAKTKKEAEALILSGEGLEIGQPVIVEYGDTSCETVVETLEVKF